MRLALAALSAALIALPAAAEDVPDLTGFWNAPIQSFDMPADLEARLPANTVVIDDTGAAEFPRGVFGGLKLTPQAAAHAETWRAEDDMTLTRACLPPSIVYSVQGPFPFEIHQAPGLLVFRYEYYDQVRLVFTDGRGHLPADAPHSKMGHSIGWWEGEELVVDTTHLAASTITNNGLDHSENVHMVERYRLTNGGKTLEASQWFEDAETLENNGARYIRWERGNDYVRPYECDPSFALEYQGVIAEDAP
jgi:hypothetical protein